MCQLRILPFVFICSLALSQPPAPTPTKPTQNDESKTTSKDGVTGDHKSDSNSFSPSINQPTSEIAAGKKQSDATPEKGTSSAEWWQKWSTMVSAVATFLIAVLAFFQWRAMQKQRIAMEKQAEYMRNGLAETHKAADAATLSADTAKRALHLLEGADVFVSDVFTTAPFTSNSPITIKIRNYGRTRADGVVMKASLTIPIQHTHGKDVIFAYPGTAIAIPANSEQMMQIGPANQVPQETIERINSGNLQLSLAIDIFYSDIFGITHATTGEGRFEPKTGRFVVKGFSHT